MQGKDEEALRQAIARNCSVVLSLPSAGMLRHHKSRLLAEDGGDILIESVPSEGALIQSLITTGDRCGLAFKSATAKVVFASSIKAVISRFVLTGDTCVEALRITFPAEIKSVQRRTNYRVPIPAEYELTLCVWRIAAQADLATEPSATALVPATIRDLSVGGAGVTMVGKDGKMPLIDVEDRLRIEIKTPQHRLILEGQLRKATRQDVGLIVSGITFKKLQDDLEGRQITATLTRIVGELQRDELRRVRMGMVGSAA